VKILINPKNILNEKDEDKEGQNKTSIQNNLIMERVFDKDKTKTRNKKNKFPNSKTEAHRIKFKDVINNKILNHSYGIDSKIKFNQLIIDINSINDENIKNIKKSTKRKQTKNKKEKIIQWI